MKLLPAIDDVRALQWSNGIRFGVALLTGVLLARSGMPMPTIALYEFLFFLSNLVSFFWINGGRNAVLAAWAADTSPEEGGFPPGTLGLFLLAGVLAGAVIWAGTPWFRDWAPESASDAHFGWLALLTFLSIPASLTETWLLLDRRHPELLQISALSQVATLIAVALPLALGYDLAAILAGLTLLQGIRLVWLLRDLRISARGNLLRASPAWTMPFVWFSLPFIGHAVLGGLMDYVDGALVLRLFPDPDQFALFRYGAKEVPLSMLLVSGVVTALVPRIREDLPGTLVRMREHQVKLSHWLFPVSCILALVSPLLFRSVYGEAFTRAATIFNIYLLVLPSRILMPQTILYGQGHREALLAIGALEVLANAALSVLLAKHLGIGGIAWATVIAFSLGKVLMIVYVRFRTGIPASHYVSWPIFAAYTLLITFCYMAGEMLHFGS